MDCPSLIKVEEKIGFKGVEALVRMWVMDLNGSLSVKRKMNEQDIINATDMILTEFKLMKQSDIYLFFKRAKYAYYGEYYESFGVEKLYHMMKRYWSDRAESNASNSEYQSNKYKGESAKPYHENIVKEIKSLKDVGESLDLKTEEEKNREALAQYYAAQQKGDLSSMGVLPKNERD